MVTASSNSRYTQLKYFLTCSINPHGVPNTDLLRTHLGNLPSWAKRLLRMAGNGAETWTRSDVPARLPATALLSPRSARPYGNKCDRRPNGCQLELGLKEHVRGAAPKSARTAKNLFCSMRYWQSGSFFSSSTN